MATEYLVPRLATEYLAPRLASEYLVPRSLKGWRYPVTCPDFTCPLKDFGEMNPPTVLTATAADLPLPPTQGCP